MTLMKKPLSPAKKLREALKKRIAELKSVLPHNWIVLYLYEFPEDKGQEDFLRNLIAGKTLHEPTIKKIERLAENIKFKNLI